MPGLTLYNAKVYTLDDSRPIATAIAAVGGRITAVGTDEAVLAAAPPCSRAIDLAGRTILPGLADAHGHLRNLGLLSEMVDLRGARSIEEAVERVRQRARLTPEGRWIQGRGWN